MRKSFFLRKSIAKLRNAPFPRPCGATGNDARKLHALAFARFRSALLMHEVLYQILIIRHQQLHHGDDDKNSVHNGTPSK